jgi:hypothetical protein
MMLNFSKGDHLVTNIDIAGVTEHHGIYVGNQMVIHLTAEDEEVVLTGLYSFSDGNEVIIKRTAPDPDNAVKSASAKIGQKGYNLISNNCEQFVNECIKGYRTSNQVSNSSHATAHALARTGILGSSAAKLATSTVGVVTIASTGAKYVGEYVGLPDSINTVIGAPGDLIGKPIESAVTGIFSTVGNTYDKLSEGEIVDAAGELIGGTVETAVNIVSAPFEVVGDVFDAIGSWWD